MTEHNSDGLKFTVKNVYDSYAGENRDKITVNRNGGGSYSYESALDWALRMKQTPGNYPLYVSSDNLLVIDNAKNNRDVPVPDVLKKYFPFEDNADTTEIAEAAKSAGFDGVMFKHIGDVAPGYGDGETHNTLDSFYSELAEEYPGLLPEEADEYHQIYSILAAWDGIQPVVFPAFIRIDTGRKR